jgi:hypothetical protein
MFAERQLTLRFRTKSLRRGSRQFRAIARSRSRDSPLMRGAEDTDGEQRKR